MAFIIDENNWNKADVKVVNLKLTYETVVNAKMRYFFRRETNVASGIELIFTQNNLTFTTNILLRDFFLAPSFSFLKILVHLIGAEIHVVFLPERLNQAPFFQIDEILHNNWLNLKLENYLPEKTGYFSADLLIGREILKERVFSEEINLHKKTLTINNDAFYSLAHCKDVNHLLRAHFFNAENKVYAYGLVTIEDFCNWPEISFLQIVKHTWNKQFVLKDSVVGAEKAEYFYFFKDKFVPATNGDAKALSPKITAYLAKKKNNVAELKVAETPTKKTNDETTSFTLKKNNSSQFINNRKIR